MAKAEDRVLITTAPKSPRQEQRERERRYLATMGVRLLCLIAAIVLYGVNLKWEAGIAIVGSLTLPWVAVVVANAGPKRSAPEQPALYAGRRPDELDNADR